MRTTSTQNWKDQMQEQSLVARGGDKKILAK